MSFLSDLERNIDPKHILVFFGAVVLLYAVLTYSDQKFALPSETLVSSQNDRQATTGHPALPSGGNGYAAVDSMTGQGGAPPAGATNMPVANPSDLLPRDTNNQWGSLNPAGSGDLSGQNLLSATFLTGIDTIGNTMKNANLQLRSEPPNPQLNVGPWNQSTFAPDLMRTPLELGAGSQ
jgi:hypothetical protein